MVSITVFNAIAVGLGGYSLATGKSYPILGKLGPVLITGLGLADMFGLLTFNQIGQAIKGAIPRDIFGGYGAWERPRGDNNNNYYSGYVGVYPYYDPRTGSYLYPRY